MTNLCKFVSGFQKCHLFLCTTIRNAKKKHFKNVTTSPLPIVAWETFCFFCTSNHNIESCEDRSIIGKEWKNNLILMKKCFHFNNNFYVPLCIQYASDVGRCFVLMEAGHTGTLYRPFVGLDLFRFFF